MSRAIKRLVRTAFAFGSLAACSAAATPEAIEGPAADAGSSSEAGSTLTDASSSSSEGGGTPIDGAATTDATSTDSGANADAGSVDASQDVDVDAAVAGPLSLTITNVTGSSADATFAYTTDAASPQGELVLLTSATPPKSTTCADIAIDPAIFDVVPVDASGNYTFVGLDPSTTYTAVACFPAAGHDEVTHVTFTTTSGVADAAADAKTDSGAPPATPTYANCTNLDNGPDVHWSGTTASYWVTVRKAGFEPATCTDVGAQLVSGTSYSVSGMLATSYVVWVCATNAAGTSAPLRISVVEPISVGNNATCSKL